MSALSTILRPAVANWHGAFSRLLSAFCNGMVDYFVRRAAIKTLCELDDRALRDIGLERSQIEAAVRGLVAVSRSSERLTMASSDAIGPRANGRRRASTKEAVSWN